VRRPKVRWNQRRACLLPSSGRAKSERTQSHRAASRPEGCMRRASSARTSRRSSRRIRRFAGPASLRTLQEWQCSWPPTRQVGQPASALGVRRPALAADQGGVLQPWRQAHLPAALLTRPRPHRAGLRQAQGRPTQGSSTQHRDRHTGDCTHPALVLIRGMHQLLQALRICVHVK
jgi:hypothetical protein